MNTCLEKKPFALSQSCSKRVRPPPHVRGDGLVNVSIICVLRHIALPYALKALYPEARNRVIIAFGRADVHALALEKVGVNRLAQGIVRAAQPAREVAGRVLGLTQFENTA